MTNRIIIGLVGLLIIKLRDNSIELKIVKLSHVIIQMHADVTVILLSLQASLAVIIVTGLHIIKEFSMNYFAKTVYSITTETFPLDVYRRFSQAI